MQKTWFLLLFIPLLAMAPRRSFMPDGTIRLTDKTIPTMDVEVVIVTDSSATVRYVEGTKIQEVTYPASEIRSITYPGGSSTSMGGKLIHAKQKPLSYE